MIAAVTVPTKLAAMSAMRLGSISTVMMRRSGSPFARAARTKSRLRSDIVCARSTRAPHAQPMRPSTVGDDPQRRVFEHRRHDDDERDARDHEEDVGESRQAFAPPAAHVARRHADDDRDDRGDDRGQEADHDDTARAVDDLAQHVLADVGRAQPDARPRAAGTAPCC